MRRVICLAYYTNPISVNHADGDDGNNIGNDDDEQPMTGHLHKSSPSIKPTEVVKALACKLPIWILSDTP